MYTRVREPSVRTRVLWVWAVIALACALSACPSSAEQRDPAQSANETPAPKPVRVATVEPNESARVFSLTGVIRSASRAELAFQVGGRLAERPVQIGSEVDKGDLIARLDQPELGPAADAARAEVAQLRTQAAQAQRDLDRVRQLVEQDAATREELETTRSRRDSARAQLAEARAQSARATNMAEELRIKAPLAGTVEQVFFEPGESVPAGQPVVALSGARVLEVEIGVPERLLTHVHTGDPAILTLPFFDDREIRGQVTQLARATRGRGQLFSAVISLADAPELHPGLSVNWHLASPPSNRLRVPISAVASPGGTDKPRVYRVRDGAARAVFVTLGDIVGENVLISGSLDAGDRVVTAGLNNLTDGRAVRVLNE